MKRILVVLLVPALLSAAQTYYPSGLLKRFSAGPSRTPVSDREAVGGFLERYFAGLPAGYEWREQGAIADNTHIHHTYRLFFRGRRVADQILKLHYNRDGWVQYASSSLAFVGSLELPENRDAHHAELEAELRRQFNSRYGENLTAIAMEPVIWMDSGREREVAAFEVILTGEHQGVFRKFLVDEATGRVLEEKRWVRPLSYSSFNFSSNIFLTSPLDTLSSEALTSDSSSELQSGYVYARFENPGSPPLTDVPGADYSGSINPNPSGYNYTCSGPAASCSDQAFDAINIFFHLNNYRQSLNQAYADLGITHTFVSDPLPVIVNSLSSATNSSDGPGQSTNNAAFVPGGCRPSQNIDKCLIFLHPAQVTNNICGSSTVNFYDLAREALIIVHEYQHYITDSVAQLIPGSTGPNVGDAIHEGYSDYFAASQVSSLAGKNVTVVGAYAAQECAALQRDVSVPKVFANDDSTTDPHIAGLTWASGLWQLRVSLGKKATDELAYKSQFFLPSLPGFVDVVEALVRADLALNQGTHVATIRALFYDQLRFIGGQTGVFTDSANEVAEVGFGSCAGIAAGRARARSPLSAITWLGCLAWLLFTAWIGRCIRMARRESP